MKVKGTSQEKSVAAKATNGKGGFSLISNEKLLELYAAMVKCRMLAKRAGLLSQRGKLGNNLHVSPGREAIAAGVTVDLLPDDALSISHSDAAPSLIKGVPVDRIFSGFVAPTNGHGGRRSVEGKDGYAPLNIIPPHSTTAAQLHTACGVALANKMAKNSRITVAFCAGASDSLDSCREALAFAGLHDLPLLIAFHDEARRESEGGMIQSKGEGIAAISHACGVPAITVDGNDVVAVYRVAYESITRARQGRGPTLIECKSYHLHGHPGIDRKAAKGLDTNDPIRMMETYLQRKGLFDTRLKRRIAAGFSKELDVAVKFLGD